MTRRKRVAPLWWLRLLAWLGHSRSRRRLGQFNRKRHSSFVDRLSQASGDGCSHPTIVAEPTK